MSRILIIGRASGVWREIVTAVEAVGAFDVVIAVNGVGCDYPSVIDHWVSFHTLLFAHWLELRRARGYPDCTSLWSSDYHGRGEIVSPRVPQVRRVACNGGSSGLVAVKVARHVYPDGKCVLAGIPMDPERGHYDQPGPWREAIQHRAAWEEAVPTIRDHVRSMSGWTMKLLGYPTRAWATDAGV